MWGEGGGVLTLCSAATQDFLTASWLISRKDAFYERAEFCYYASFLAVRGGGWG
jgi:hypothetical protein